MSGLITREIPRGHADEIVFGTTEINCAGAAFGVVDLVDDLVETDSKRVHPTPRHVARLLDRVRELDARFACVIHSKVRDSLNHYGQLRSQMGYGWCGPVLPNCTTEFVVNSFPNGNSIVDAEKIRIFRLLRDRLLLSAPAALVPEATPPARSLRARGEESYRTQRVTSADLLGGRIRIPSTSSSSTKSLLPTVKTMVELVLRGRPMRVSWDPRMGPDRERSGVLRVGATIRELVRENEVLMATTCDDGTVAIG